MPRCSTVCSGCQVLGRYGDPGATMVEPLEPALELVGVAKRYRRSGPWVLDAAALTVMPGEAVQVLGRNGSGKTTLLRVAAGLARATAGSVHRPGACTYVPERLLEAPPATVQTFLLHQGRIQGLSGPALGDAVTSVIDDHELGAVADRPMRELSKGWMQRTVLAQALLMPRAVVFLDEPWTGVDALSHDHLISVIEASLRAGSAVLMTSHEDNRLDHLRRVRLVDGRLVDDLDPAPGAPDARATRRVVLLARQRDDAKPAVELLEQTGVVEGHVVDEGVVIVIDDESGDDVLRCALDAGWTIRRLELRESS